MHGVNTPISTPRGSQALFDVSLTRRWARSQVHFSIRMHAAVVCELMETLAFLSSFFAGRYLRPADIRFRKLGLPEPPSVLLPPPASIDILNKVTHL